MYRIQAGGFVRFGSILQSFFSNFKADALPGAPVHPDQAKLLVEELQKLLDDCDSLDLPKTKALGQGVICNYQMVGHNQAQLKSTITCINAQLISELEERMFAQIEPDRQRYLMNPEEFANDPLFGANVANAFSTTNEDTRMAACCYATFNHTACVFHAMRILEKGMIALANALAVPFDMPFEYQNWQSIIGAIEKAIRDFEKSPGKSPHKTEKLKQYGEAASQLFYVKAAWRNHVAHSRDVYDGEQAKLILDHIGELMRYLVKLGLHD